MKTLVSRWQLPSNAQASAYFPTKQGQSSKVSSEGKLGSDVVPLNFPATKDILWDRTPKGDPTVLHITKYRNISLHILEKSVQLAHRHALQSDSLPYRCFLIGSVLSDKDEEGVTITIDRFDPGRDVPGRSSRMPTARLPGDYLIPLTMSINEETMATTHSSEDFTATFKLLEHNCSSRDTLDVGGVLSFRIHCRCYDNADDVTFNLHIGAVTMGTVLEATPINPLPIIPTALARNLTGPLNLSEIQGTPKVGFITMDQTRKLLLLLESDPKAYTLPLIGIWLSGLSNICSPYVWTSCLRYIFNSSINERVCTGDQGFLLVLFSPTNRQPAFYECRSLSGDEPSFELVGCRENIHFYKHTDQTSRTPVQLELTPARDGPNKAAFMDAARQFTPSCQAKRTKPRPKPAPLPRPVTTDEDVHIMPRPSPKPLIDKSPTVKPSVPELSLIFDSFVEDQEESDQLPRRQNPTDHPAPFGEVISNQDDPRKRRPQHQGPDQNAQENHPFGVGQNGRGGFHGRGTKAGLVETPTGRPGPLKPVNTNFVYGGEKSRRSNLNNSQGNVKRTPPGMKPKITPSPAQNAKGQQPIIKTNRTPRSDSVPRQKPPRPTSRKSEVLQHTLPLTVGGHRISPSQERKCEAPRRMSDPIPMSSSRTSQRCGGQVLHLRPGQSNQAAHPTVHRRSDLQHLPPQQAWGATQQNQSPGPLYHQEVFHNGNPSSSRQPVQVTQASPTHATSSGNTSPHSVPRTQVLSSSSSNCKGIPVSPNATPNSVSNVSKSASYQGHNASGASLIPHPNPVTSQYGPSHTGTPPTLTGFSQSPHGVREASDFHSNWVHSPQDRLTGSHSSDLVGSHEIPHRHQGPQPNTLCHAKECTSRNSGPSALLPPSGTTPEGPPQPLVSNGQQSHHQDQNRGERDSDSNDTMAQLKRQDQLIQQLQAQIQMLMQAQAAQSNPPIPSRLITPSATPTSQETNLHLSTPMPHLSQSPGLNQTPPVSSGTGQQVATRTSQPSVASTTHSVSTDTGGNTPHPKTTCSMAVMTGKSLLWPDETSSPVKTSLSVSTSMTPRSSPNRGSKATTSGHVTFDTVVTLDPESDLEITLPMQQMRDDTQSAMFDVSAVDLRSFTEDGSPRQTSSPNRSPKWAPSREGNTPQATHPETTQGTYPMDSLHSPVLGESASTCAPPGRGWGHPRNNDTRDGSNSDDGGSCEEGRAESDEETSDSDEERPTGSTNQPVSLLYRDERKFYQNLLGKVEQMLTDQTQDGDGCNRGIAMTTQEELRQMGLPTAVDHSVMYRSMCMVNSDFFPRINYVSLMDVHLDSPNLSYEANAIAMKYLTEDELTQLSAGFKGQQTPLPKVNPLLRTALTGIGDNGTGAGPSAVDLSMASRKYMEKYGLLDMPVRKPDRARALGFDKSPAQRIVARNTPRTKDLTKKPRKTTKLKMTGPSNAPVAANQIKTLPGALDDIQECKLENQPTRRIDARHSEKPSTENSPALKPSRSSPISTSPPRPLGRNETESRTREGQNNQGSEKAKTGSTKGKTSDKNKEQKSGSNILDIQRLKQLPKLF